MTDDTHEQFQTQASLNSEKSTGAYIASNHRPARNIVQSTLTQLVGPQLENNQQVLAIEGGEEAKK